MPLREDILAPIPGANPSGESLEYAPVYDQIKQARREQEDALDEGARKVADWKLVMQLSSDALAKQSKDLWLAAWLTEALLRRENFAGLRSGLSLNQSLIQDFWDTLYPLIEDGDMDYRAAPLHFLGTGLIDPLKKVPLTKAGYNFYKYQESRAVGYEQDAEESTTKAEARQKAIEEGKLTGEAFDIAFRDTSKDFFKKAVEDLDASLDGLRALGAICDEKFGQDASPNFRALQEAIEEVRRVTNNLYQQKRKLAGELDEPAETTADEEPAPEETGAVAVSASGAAAAPARAPARKAVAGLEPADRDEVALRLSAIAKYLREQDSSDPAPYLMLRGYRWGELRKSGSRPDATVLEAPSTEVRTQLKKAIMDSDWVTAIEIGEAAMAQPCGRGWLDLQRYIVSAVDYPIAEAIKSEVRTLVRDIPELRRMTLMDDTPTANPDTQAWLDQIIAEAAGSEPQRTPAMQEEDEEETAAEDEAAPPDAYELAVQAIRERRSKDAVELLMQEVGRQSSGRGRFRRKQQLAEICMQLGEMSIAQPILEELLAEIDEHRLEDWEAADSVAYPLTMLLQCLGKLDGDAAERQKIYHRICRLDPVQALNCKP